MHVKYNGEGETDWTSDNFTFTSFYGDPVKTAVQKKNGQWGYYTKYYYYPTAPDESSWTTIDESLVTVDPSDPNKGTAMIKPSGSKFLLDNGNFNNSTSKLSGVAFPNHKDFTAIPDNVFGNDGGPAGLTSATVGSNLLYIGEHAFKNTQLASFIFPAELKVIAPEAFDKCKLTSVNLQSCTNLVKIDYEAFEYNYDLAEILFPESDNLTYIGNDAFKDAREVTEIDMSMCGGIQYFYTNGSNYKQFYGCSELTTLILPPDLRIFPGGDENSSIIAKCPKLTTVTFTGQGIYDKDCKLTNPLVIENSAFYEKNNLKYVTLSDNLVRIETYGFNKCTALETIHIPASVEMLEQMAFQSCWSLTTVIFDDIRDCNCGETTKKAAGAATYVSGGEGQGGQGAGAFQDCYSITDVYINNSTEINCQNNAFDQRISWGASNPTANFATLHFREESINHYVNLRHALTDDEVADPGKFHEWLMKHYDLAGVPNRNGWYEFVNSGPSKGPQDPGCEEIVLQTFSDWNNSYLVPDGLRAYVVTDVQPEPVAQGEDPSGIYSLTLQRIFVIPKQTGVILYGHPNGKTQNGNPSVVMTPVHFYQKGDPIYSETEPNKITGYYKGEDQGVPLRLANYNDGKIDVINYLEPTSSPTPADVTKLQNTITSLEQQVEEAEEGSYERAELENQLSRKRTELSTLQSLMNEHKEWKTSENGSYDGGIFLKPFGNVDDNPFKVNTGGAVAFRNFGLGRYNATEDFTNKQTLEGEETDYAAFFRLVKAYYPTGKAYLHLPADVYPEEYGAEILVNKDEVKDNNGAVTFGYFYEMSKESTGTYFDARTQTTNNPKGWWNVKQGFDWDIVDEAFPIKDENNVVIGNKPRLNWGVCPERLKKIELAPKYFGELEENADGIVKLVVPASNNGEYYTLQGVKVSHPTKGVYIRNGKKVIIK